MRFKNYINRFNRSNRIYSDEDILKMTLEKILDDEDSIMSQSSEIGIPTHSELEASPYTEWVNSGDDDFKKGYWRSIVQQPEIEMATGLLSEKPIEMLDTSNKNISALTTNNINNKINDEKFLLNNEDSPLIQGGVQKYDFRYLDKILPDKYKGLSLLEAVQKAASKIPIDTVEREYYGLSAKLKDREMVEDKTMEENDIYSFKDITDPKLSEQYKEYLAKMYKLDPNDSATYEKIMDKQIVVPKDTSRLYQYAKNSEVLQRWVADNYERIKNGEAPTQNFLEFSRKDLKDDAARGLYATIHKAGINGNINSDGSLNIELSDVYDFDKMDSVITTKARNLNELYNNLAHNIFAIINNNALKQQQAEQIETYPLFMSIKLMPEEIKEILKCFGKKGKL